MKGLSIINTGMIVLLTVGAVGNHGMVGFNFNAEASETTELTLEDRIAALELALAAKIPEPIKFYTIPGYACDTTEWPGLCSNLGIDQAEYDKKNSHLFKVTDNQKGN